VTKKLSEVIQCEIVNRLHHLDRVTLYDSINSEGFSVTLAPPKITHHAVSIDGLVVCLHVCYITCIYTALLVTMLGIV
jgi:hypothetical protein